MRQRSPFPTTMLTDDVLPDPSGKTLCPVCTRTMVGPRFLR
jgi:hypothetical protein